MRISIATARGLLAALGALAAAVQAQPVTLEHVHGLAYSADGGKLMVPSHHGLAVYADGRWSKAPGPLHDYMGFSATARHLYSSGHPAPGSGLVNPFGLIRSADGGRTWEKLGLQGESDFHLLAAGWTSGAIYVWNPAPSSRMKEPGLHFTRNDGVVWKRAAALGLRGEPAALAAHPEDPALLAAATRGGIFVSRDFGEHFAPVAAGPEGLAVFFDLDGKHLWYSTWNGTARLARAPLSGGVNAEVKLPPLARDAVAYIAQNPARRSEYAIATFGRDVYVSGDAGRTWRAIALRGEGK